MSNAGPTLTNYGGTVVNTPPHLTVSYGFGAPMTPDRIQEIRQIAEKAAKDCIDYQRGQQTYPHGKAFANIIQEAILAALATAHAEGRRQGIEQAAQALENAPGIDTGRSIVGPSQSACRYWALDIVRQLLPQTPHP